MIKKYKDGDDITLNGGSHTVSLKGAYIKVSGPGFRTEQHKVSHVSSFGIITSNFNIRNNSEEYVGGRLLVDIKSDGVGSTTVSINPFKKNYEVLENHNIL